MILIRVLIEILPLKVVSTFDVSLIYVNFTVHSALNQLIMLVEPVQFQVRQPLQTSSG